MNRIVKECLAAAVATGLLLMPACKEKEHEGEAPPTSAPAEVTTAPGSEKLVVLGRETQQRVGMKIEVLVAEALRPEVTAYGRLEEDPARSFTLRAPIAGVLRPAKDAKWPDLGETIADGATVAMIEPRFAPTDRVNLASQLVQAKANVEESTAALSAAKASYDSKKALNAEERIVADRTLEEAKAAMAGAEARLTAAKNTVRLIEESLTSDKGPAQPSPLSVERGGQVVEVFARPGEAIESGQPILRAVKFDRLIARVAFPPGTTLDPGAATARVFVTGYEDRPLSGEKIAIGGAVDPGSQGQILLFRVAAGGFPLRPGVAVTARVAVPGEPLKGVIIPRSALVRAAGQAWAYVQVGEDRFSRRPLALEQPTENGWFATSGFEAGARVVVIGAQTLLSEEMKAQIEAEAGAAE
jgi:hypothetical protein